MYTPSIHMHTFHAHTHTMHTHTHTPYDHTTPTHHTLYTHSAFARFPNGIIEHYFCAKGKIAPEQDKEAQKPYADTNPF